MYGSDHRVILRCSQIFAPGLSRPEANGAAQDRTVRLAPLLIESKYHRTIYIACTQSGFAYKSTWCVGEVLLVS